MTAPRPASEAPFPYSSRHVCYFILDDNSRPQAVSGKEALRVVIESRDELFAVWPGEYRSDLFVIDDPAALLEAISPKKRVAS